MEINWDKVRRVILDNRLKRCYKPDKAVLRYIGQLLPDSVIFGFAYIPQLNLWGLLVESSSFPENPYGIIRDMSYNEIYRYSPTNPVIPLPAKQL